MSKCAACGAERPAQGAKLASTNRREPLCMACYRQFRAGAALPVRGVVMRMCNVVDVKFDLWHLVDAGLMGNVEGTPMCSYCASARLAAQCATSTNTCDQECPPSPTRAEARSPVSVTASTTAAISVSGRSKAAEVLPPAAPAAQVSPAPPQNTALDVNVDSALLQLAAAAEEVGRLEAVEAANTAVFEVPALHEPARAPAEGSAPAVEGLPPLPPAENKPGKRKRGDARGLPMPPAQIPRLEVAAGSENDELLLHGTPGSLEVCYEEVIQHLRCALSQVEQARWHLPVQHTLPSVMQAFGRIELAIAVCGPQGAGKTTVVNELLSVGTCSIENYPFCQMETNMPVLVELQRDGEDQETLEVVHRTFDGDIELLKCTYNDASLREAMRVIRDVFDDMHPDRLTSARLDSLHGHHLVVRGPFPGLQVLSNELSKKACPAGSQSSKFPTRIAVSVIDCPAHGADTMLTPMLQKAHVIIQLNPEQRWHPKPDVFDSVLKVLGPRLSFATRPLLIATTNVTKLFQDLAGSFSEEDRSRSLSALQSSSNAARLAGMLRDTFGHRWVVQDDDGLTFAKSLLSTASFIPFMPERTRSSHAEARGVTGLRHPFCESLIAALSPHCSQVLLSHCLFRATKTLNQMAQYLSDLRGSGRFIPAAQGVAPRPPLPEHASLETELQGAVAAALSTFQPSEVPRDSVLKSEIQQELVQNCFSAAELLEFSVDEARRIWTKYRSFSEVRVVCLAIVKRLLDYDLEEVHHRALQATFAHLNVPATAEGASVEYTAICRSIRSLCPVHPWPSIAADDQSSEAQPPLPDAWFDRTQVSRAEIVDKLAELHFASMKRYLLLCKQVCTTAVTEFRTLVQECLPGAVACRVLMQDPAAARVRRLQKFVVATKKLLSHLDPEFDLRPRQLVLAHPHLVDPSRELEGAITRPLLHQTESIAVPDAHPGDLLSLSRSTSWAMLCRRLSLRPATLQQLCLEAFGKDVAEGVRFTSLRDAFTQVTEGKPIAEPDIAKLVGCFGRHSIATRIVEGGSAGVIHAQAEDLAMVFHTQQADQDRMAAHLRWMQQPPDTDNRVRLHPIFVIPEFPTKVTHKRRRHSPEAPAVVTHKDWADMNPLLSFQGKRLERGVRGQQLQSQAALGGLENRRALLLIVVPEKELATVQHVWAQRLAEAAVEDAVNRKERQTVLFLTYKHCVGFDFVVDLSVLAASAFHFPNFHLVTSPVSRCQEAFEDTDMWMNVSTFRLLATLQENFEEHFIVQTPAVGREATLESVVAAVINRYPAVKDTAFSRFLKNAWQTVLRDPLAAILQYAVKRKNECAQRNAEDIAAIIRTTLAEQGLCTVVGSSCGIAGDKVKGPPCSLRFYANQAGAIYLTTSAVRDLLRLPAEVLLWDGKHEVQCDETKTMMLRDKVLNAIHDSYQVVRSHWEQVDCPTLAFLLRHITPSRLTHCDGGLWFDGVLQANQLLVIHNKRLTIRWRE